MTQVKPLLRPPDLVEHPQLATIELLRRVLEVTRMALLAAHPELHADEYIPSSTDKDTLAARDAIGAIDALLPRLMSYRRALQAVHDSLDVPF